MKKTFTQLWVDYLLEEDNSDDAVAELYAAWVLQRGGTTPDLSNFTLWLKQVYPDKVARAKELFSLVGQKLGGQTAQPAASAA